MPKSLVSFSLPVAYRCSPVSAGGGRRRYQPLETLLNEEGEYSTVGTSTGRAFLPDLRKSRHYKAEFDFTFDHRRAVAWLTELAEPDVGSVRWPPKNHVFDVIRYEAGGFFKEHRDKLIDHDHYATLLIFPPAIGEFAHSGGDLILTDVDGSVVRFQSSTNMEWRFIAFHPHLRHECLPVLSGTRVVIKTELRYQYEQPSDHKFNFSVRPEMFVD